MGAAVAFGAGRADAAGAVEEAGEVSASAEGTSSGMKPGTGVTAGSGVLSAYISTICSAGAVQPENITIKAEAKNKIFFMEYPFKTIYTF